MNNCNPYNSKLCEHLELMVDVALLLGNDYMKRIHNNGPVIVLGQYKNTALPPKNEPRGLRKDNGLIDRLANAENKVDFINIFGNNGRKALTVEQQNTYWKAKKYMLHAPVIRQNKNTNELHISPSNDLPSPNEETE